jgi:hypothetical protein
VPVGLAGFHRTSVVNGPSSASKAKGRDGHAGPVGVLDEGTGAGEQAGRGGCDEAVGVGRVPGQAVHAVPGEVRGLPFPGIGEGIGEGGGGGVGRPEPEHAHPPHPPSGPAGGDGRVRIGELAGADVDDVVGAVAERAEVDVQAAAGQRVGVAPQGRVGIGDPAAQRRPGRAGVVGVPDSAGGGGRVGPYPVVADRDVPDPAADPRASAGLPVQHDRRAEGDPGVRRAGGRRGRAQCGRGCTGSAWPAGEQPRDQRVAPVVERPPSPAVVRQGGRRARRPQVAGHGCTAGPASVTDPVAGSTRM